MSKQKKILITSILASVLLNILIVVVNIKQAALTAFSIPACAFIVCSIIYAMIAYDMRDSGNLLLIGSDKIFWIIRHSFKTSEYVTSHKDYEKEFRMTLLIYCFFIPCYIPMIFLSKSFFGSYMSILSVLFIEELIIIFAFVFFRLTSQVKSDREQKLSDEATRKEQEKRESMGKWK